MPMHALPDALSARFPSRELTFSRLVLWKQSMEYSANRLFLAPVLRREVVCIWEENLIRIELASLLASFMASLFSRVSGKNDL